MSAASRFVIEGFYFFPPPPHLRPRRFFSPRLGEGKGLWRPLRPQSHLRQMKRLLSSLPQLFSPVLPFSSDVFFARRDEPNFFFLPLPIRQKRMGSGKGRLRH